MKTVFSAFAFALSVVSLGCSVAGLEDASPEPSLDTQAAAYYGTPPSNICEVTATVDGCGKGTLRYWIYTNNKTYIQMCPGETKEACQKAHNLWAYPICVDSVFTNPVSPPESTSESDKVCHDGQSCTPQTACTTATVTAEVDPNTGKPKIVATTGCEYMVKDGYVLWAKGKINNSTLIDTCRDQGYPIILPTK